jgi:hypothetical protein
MNTEYRIAEEHNRFRIQYSNGWEWHDLKLSHVPRFHDTLQDARAWVATIKRGVVYHDAEDAPNLAQNESKAEDDTSNGIKPLEWFQERIGKQVLETNTEIIEHDPDARFKYDQQRAYGTRYFDPR